MKTLLRNAMVVSALAGLVACSGAPVQLGSSGPAPVSSAPVRELSSRACGFQLMLFIPIVINNRAQRAWADLQQQAGDDYLTDVQIKETWTYAFAGTSHCTYMQAKAIPRS